MCQAPDGLVHNTEIFGGCEIGALPTKVNKNKIGRKEDGGQGNQPGCYPEQARAGHRFGGRIEIEAISPDS